MFMKKSTELTVGVPYSDISGIDAIQDILPT